MAKQRLIQRLYFTGNKAYNNGLDIKMNLKHVNKLIREKKIQEALDTLEELQNKYPDFFLYQQKIDECKNLLKKYKLHSNQTRKPIDLTLSINQNISKDIPKIISEAEALAKNKDTVKARALLTGLSKSTPKNPNIILELACLDFIDSRYEDCVKKCKTVINVDKNNRKAYQVAERASIELKNYDEAHSFFLSQPPIKNPATPRKRGKNISLPANFVLPPLDGAGHDYTHISRQVQIFEQSGAPYTKTVSIIIPVYNRYKLLANTLAALTHQTYPKDLIEIIVVDDGSPDEIMSVIKKYEQRLNLYYARQRDQGYKLSAVRNIGLRMARKDYIIMFDADILPLPNDVEEFMKFYHVSDDAVLIGHRKYVDVSSITDDIVLKDINSVLNLPTINPNNDVADRRTETGVSIDWRLPVYEKTDYLKADLLPFGKWAGGNISFPKQVLKDAGYFDEEFEAWGCEDGEFGYRIFNAGYYFIPVMKIMSLHQEPLEEVKAFGDSTKPSFRKIGHKITKNIYSRKCPAPGVRMYEPGTVFEVPKVSIYIPAYNAARYIKEAVDTCLNQNFDDLEVCICNDGSTDDTLQVLENNYSINPKVSWITQKNGGIGKASNAAVAMCRGMYIGQLDADDVLKPEAIETCVKVLDSSDVDAVYADYNIIDEKGNYIRDGWCGGEFSREWQLTGMLATHFRMFRKRIWNRTTGFDETIKNAVDFDFWLKINEKGKIQHIHEILYSYRWHGENTSIRDRKIQEKNHLKAANNSLLRLGLNRYWAFESADNKVNPRELRLKQKKNICSVLPKDIIILIPTCDKYKSKADAIRQTWANDASSKGFRSFFLQGDPTILTTKVENDTIFVPCADTYEALLLKLALGHKFLYKNFDFSYVFKIDDDCYLNISNFMDDIIPQLQGMQYVGGATHPKGANINNMWHIGKCEEEKFDTPYKFNKAPVEFAKGAYGYMLRKDILPVIFELTAVFMKELENGLYSYEDLRLAQILAEREIYSRKFINYVIQDGRDALNLKNWTVTYDIQDYGLFYSLYKMYGLGSTCKAAQV